MTQRAPERRNLAERTFAIKILSFPRFLIFLIAISFYLFLSFSFSPLSLIVFSFTTEIGDIPASLSFRNLVILVKRRFRESLAESLLFRPEDNIRFNLQRNHSRTLKLAKPNLVVEFSRIFPNFPGARSKSRDPRRLLPRITILAKYELPSYRPPAAPFYFRFIVLSSRDIREMTVSLNATSRYICG